MTSLRKEERKRRYASACVHISSTCIFQRAASATPLCSGLVAGRWFLAGGSILADGRLSLITIEFSSRFLSGCPGKSVLYVEGI